MNSGLTSKVYEPYAQALLSLGQSSQLVDAFGADIALVLDALTQSEDLNAFLANPLVSEESKKGAIGQIFAGQINDLTLSFLKLLVDRRRINALTGICREFQTQLRKLKQAVLAEVISTVELNDAQKQSICDRVLGMTNAKSVDLATTIDPSLLGGVIIKVGSQVIDASLRGQLRRISYKLAGAN